MARCRNTRLKMNRHKSSNKRVQSHLQKEIAQKCVEAIAYYLEQNLRSQLPEIQNLALTVSTLDCSVNGARSQIESFIYQIGQWQNAVWQIQNMTPTLNSISSTANITISQLSNFSFRLEEESRKKIEDLMMEIRQYDIKLDISMKDLDESIKQMSKNADIVNQVATDPVISGTIDDLKMISSRFDSI